MKGVDCEENSFTYDSVYQPNIRWICEATEETKKENTLKSMYVGKKVFLLL